MLGVLAAIVLPLAGASQINIQVQSGGVHLVAAAGTHAVAIRSRTRGNASKPHVRISRRGKTIGIALTGTSGVNLPFAPGSAGSISYEIDYPAGVRIELYDLQGDITLDNSRASVSVETASGSITANNAHGGLDLAADTGDITTTLAPDWKAPSLRMQSRSGTLRLVVPRSFRAHVDASTDRGLLHDSLPHTGAQKPFVWLYTEKGDVWIAAQ